MKRAWFAWKLILAIAVVLVIVETSRVIALTNRHTVIPNKVYRCAQPNGEHLRELVKAHGIRTVINLRGVSPELPTYQEECQPSTSELKQLIEVLDRTEYPIVIHCKRGADRTGLVSTVTLLLYTDATPDEARRQLWPRFGHFRFGRTAAIDEFFDQYDAWLAKENKSHSRETFRYWMLNDYCPGPARSHLEFVNYKPRFRGNSSPECSRASMFPTSFTTRPARSTSIRGPGSGRKRCNRATLLTWFCQCRVYRPGSTPSRRSCTTPGKRVYHFARTRS
jgi:protein tyrosine phosphatase (PTP) superfamily phosphohydrolase (DUF442 family)